jgi:hypothetical protein
MNGGYRFNFGENLAFLDIVTDIGKLEGDHRTARLECNSLGRDERAGPLPRPTHVVH